MTSVEVIGAKCAFYMSTTTSSARMQRYSQELSEYTLRQFCLASAMLDEDAEAPHLSAAHRRVACQANKVRLFFKLWYHLLSKTDIIDLRSELAT